MIPTEAAADPAAACTAAEDAFHRGKVEARALAEAALSAARARGSGVIEAHAHEILGEIDYDELAYGPSLAHLSTAVALREEHLGASHDATRTSLAMRSIVLVSEERRGDADRDVERAAAGRGAPRGPDDAADNARFWVTLAAAYTTRERGDEARPILEAVLAAEPTGKVSPFALANACLHLALVFVERGDRRRAAALHEQVVARRRAVIGEPSLRVALALSALGTSRVGDGRIDEGRALMHEAASMLEACGRAAHPRASLVYLGVSVAEIMSGRGAASEPWLTRAMELEARTFGPGHASNGTMLSTAAMSYAARGFHGRAAELAQRSSAILVDHLEGRNGEVLEAVVGQGFECLRKLKRHDAIVNWLEPLAAKLERAEPRPDQILGPVLNMLGEGYYAGGRLAKAEAVLRRALALAESVHGAESEPVAVALQNLHNLLTKQKRTDEARAIEQRARRVAEAIEASALSPFKSRWRVGSA